MADLCKIVATGSTQKEEPSFCTLCPPGIHTANFFMVFFCVTQDGGSKRWTTQSLFLFGFNEELLYIH